MRIPSVKTLEAAFPGHGKALRAILTDPDPECGSVGGPSWYRKLCLVNARLQEHGVEAIHDRHGRRVFLYVNNGQTYDVTIGFDTTTKSFRVTDYGTWVERYERKRGRLP